MTRNLHDAMSLGLHTTQHYIPYSIYRLLYTANSYLTQTLWYTNSYTQYTPLYLSIPVVWNKVSRQSNSLRIPRRRSKEQRAIKNTAQIGWSSSWKLMFIANVLFICGQFVFKIGTVTSALRCNHICSNLNPKSRMKSIWRRSNEY